MNRGRDGVEQAVVSVVNEHQFSRRFHGWNLCKRTFTRQRSAKHPLLLDKDFTVARAKGIRLAITRARIVHPKAVHNEPVLMRAGRERHAHPPVAGRIFAQGQAVSRPFIEVTGKMHGFRGGGLEAEFDFTQAFGR